jgi:hypothetical protein
VSLSLTDVERLCMLEEGGRWRLWLEPDKLMLPTLFVSSLYKEIIISVFRIRIRTDVALTFCNCKV